MKIFWEAQMATYDTNEFSRADDKFQYLKDWANAGGLLNETLENLFSMVGLEEHASDYSIPTLAGTIVSAAANVVKDYAVGANMFQKIDADNEIDKKLLDTYKSKTTAYISLFSSQLPRMLQGGANTDGATSTTISTLIYNDPDVTKAFLEMLYHAYIKDKDFFTKPTNEFSTVNDIDLEILSNFISVLDEKISKTQEAVGQEGSGVSGLARAEVAGSAGAIAAVVSANAAASMGTDEEVIEKSFAEEDLRNFLQCALLKDFVNTYNNDADGRFGSIKSKETNLYTQVPYKGRITPLEMDDPGQFLNLCNFPKDMKTAFVRKSNMSESSIIPSFKYVRPLVPESDDNKYIAGYEEIELELNQKTGDITFTNLTIDFDGTNPSTARKDVKVKIELKLANLGFLDYNIAKKNKEYLFELYKLITVPYGVQQDSSVGGSIIRNQYSPDYNRIRMTLNSKMSSKVKNGNNQEDVEFKKYQTFDLAIESHEINRTDGGVTMTLNYRGYFQSLLSHPFMDALATAEVMQGRINADKDLSDLGNSCSSETIKEIIRINRMADLQNAKEHSWDKFIKNITNNTEVKWIKYTSKTSDLRVFAFTNNLDYTNTETMLCTWSGTTLPFASTTLNTLVEAQENMTDKKVKKTGDTFDLLSYGDENEVLKGDNITSAFTTVGSIMQVALESLYDGDSNANLHPKFKHLNLKFLVAPIEISNPQNPSEKINFNPLELPVDLLFFNQWFQSTIINKGITYYPVLTMIRDLIERLVNSLLLEMCFDNSQPDELPPLLRVGFFNDNTENPIVPNNNYAYKVAQAAIFKGRQRIFEHDPESENTLNTYCVIYSQNRGSYITPSDLKNHTSSPYIPVFQHGHRLIEEGKTTGDSPLSNVSFSKENMTGLKEARFFSSGGGGLNVLSNVYNLGFDLNKTGANVFIYPGQIIQFNLLDFDAYNDKWNKPDALSSIMGFGGFYVIKKTSITIKSLAGNDFTIHYDALWSGNGAGVEFRRSNDKNKIIEAKTACKTAFENAKTRYTEAGGTDQIETSIEIRRTDNPTQSGTRYYGQSSDNATAIESITEAAEGNISEAIENYKLGVVSNNSYQVTGTKLPFTSNGEREATITVKGVYQPSENVQQIKVGVVDKETGIEAEYQVNIINGAAEYIKISR